MSEHLANASARLAPYAIDFTVNLIHHDYDNMLEWMLAEERSPISYYLALALNRDFERIYEFIHLLKRTLDAPTFEPFVQAVQEPIELLRLTTDGDERDTVNEHFETYQKILELKKHCLAMSLRKHVKSMLNGANIF